jgi:pumilio family protein 6
MQCALKYGNQAQRDTIAGELSGSYVTLMKSQYGKFIVSKILNFCPKYRPFVIKEMYGQVRKLMRHRDASLVVEEAYSQFANATQRTALMEEFYGPEFSIFKVCFWSFFWYPPSCFQ